MDGSQTTSVSARCDEVAYKHMLTCHTGLQGVSILLPAIGNEWRGSRYVKLVTLALYAGLIVGATFWGISADVVG